MRNYAPQHNIFRSFGRHHSNDLISIILLHLNTSNVNPDYLMYGEARNVRECWKTILFDHIEGYRRLQTETFSINTD
jgi:hypothetical protein